MVDIAADIVVVGAGPAGAATALMLAPFHRTLVLDRADPNGTASGPARIGEALPAAARRLFRDMGLWEAFQAEGHTPCHGADSYWGGPDPVSVDCLRDPDGPGWHLDRARFDAWLRACAGARGAALVAPGKLSSLKPRGDGWELSATRHGRPFIVTARFVVDAGGRAAPVARALGHRRARSGDLVCRWLHGTAADAARRTVVAAETDGWWYTAPLPAGKRVLAFHTDADLPAVGHTSEASGLLARALAQPGLSDVLEAAGFSPSGCAGYCAAHGSRTTMVAGLGWLAVGDAALACDPLSSQGLLNALYLALMAANAVRGALAGASDALGGYQRIVGDVATAHRMHLAAWYGLEKRWAGSPFWSRRRIAIAT